MEALAAEVDRPCDGNPACAFTAASAALAEHHKQCRYRPQSCPKCHWKVPSSDLIEHFQECGVDFNVMETGDDGASFLFKGFMLDGADEWCLIPDGTMLVVKRGVVCRFTQTGGDLNAACKWKYDLCFEGPEPSCTSLQLRSRPLHILSGHTDQHIELTTSHIAALSDAKFTERVVIAYQLKVTPLELQHHDID